jgi:nitroreductase
MDVLEAIHSRRSTRQFSDEQVSSESVDTLIRAAMAAPSANNERPWRFVIVRDKETLTQLAKATPWASPLDRAPVGIVLFADTSALKMNADLWMLDCALAAQNLMLAAQSQGLGTVWLAAWPYDEYVRAIQTVLGAPDHAVPVAMLAVGIPFRDGHSDRSLRASLGLQRAIRPAVGADGRVAHQLLAGECPQPRGPRPAYIPRSRGGAL